MHGFSFHSEWFFRHCHTIGRDIARHGEAAGELVDGVNALFLNGRNILQAGTRASEKEPN